MQGLSARSLGLTFRSDLDRTEYSKKTLFWFSGNLATQGAISNGAAVFKDVVLRSVFVTVVSFQTSYFSFLTLLCSIGRRWDILFHHKSYDDATICALHCLLV